MTTTEAHDPSADASRADARPLPRRGRATSSATACGSSTRSTARASRPSSCCRPGRSSTRATGRCRSRTSRATAAWSPSTGAATAAPTGPRDAATTEREFAADALAVMDATATERAVLVSLSLGAQRALLLAAEHPERVDGRGLHRARPSPLGEPLAGRDVVPLGRGARHRRGLGEVQPPLLAAATTEGFLEFFFSQMFTEPHSTKPIEDCVGWGLETDAGDARRHRAARKGLDAETSRELCRPRALPGARDPRRRGRDHRPRAAGIALAEATGGEPRHARGLGPRPARARPGEGQPAAARVRRAAAPPPARWVRGEVAPQAGALRLVADRPRPRAARRRDRRRAAQARIPTSRSTGSRSTRSPRCSRRAGERIHPASALPGQRVRPHRERVGRARPALLPGDPADGRDPARQLHGLPRPRARRGTTTSGSATRRGSSTTTCTRTPSRSAPRTSG